MGGQGGPQFQKAIFLNLTKWKSSFQQQELVSRVLVKTLTSRMPLLQTLTNEQVLSNNKVRLMDVPWEKLNLRKPLF